MTTFTGRFSAGAVTFDAVCASLPPDRVARTATTTTTTKKPPVSALSALAASGLEAQAGRSSARTQPESAPRSSTLSQQLQAAPLAALTLLSQKPDGVPQLLGVQAINWSRRHSAKIRRRVVCDTRARPRSEWCPALECRPPPASMQAELSAVVVHPPAKREKPPSHGSRDRWDVHLCADAERRRAAAAHRRDEELDSPLRRAGAEHAGNLFIAFGETTDVLSPRCGRVYAHATVSEVVMNASRSTRIHERPLVADAIPTDRTSLRTYGLYPATSARVQKAAIVLTVTKAVSSSEPRTSGRPGWLARTRLHCKRGGDRSRAGSLQPPTTKHSGIPGPHTGSESRFR